jgi:hypothetical protein
MLTSSIFQGVPHPFITSDDYINILTADIGSGGDLVCNISIWLHCYHMEVIANFNRKEVRRLLGRWAKFSSLSTNVDMLMTSDVCSFLNDVAYPVQLGSLKFLKAFHCSERTLSVLKCTRQRCGTCTKWQYTLTLGAGILSLCMLHSWNGWYPSGSRFLSKCCQAYIRLLRT